MKFKSASKVLSFVIAVMGFIFSFKYGFNDVVIASKVLMFSFVISGLLVGNKTLVQALEKFIDTKFGGKKDA